jgi:hypothetical protein
MPLKEILFQAATVPWKLTVCPVVVATKTRAPVPVFTKFVAGVAMLPATFNCEVEAAKVKVITASRAPSPAPVAKLRQVTVVVVGMVTVNVLVPTLLLTSNITSSTAVGTLAPLAPPDVALQLVVLVVFQVPVPPTQYLSAISQPWVD